MPRTPTSTRPLAAGLALPLLLTACASGTSGTSAGTPAAEPTPPSDVQEVAASSPRLALTHDGGVRVLDAATLETVADLPLDGFNRLNGAGDGRHLLVSTQGGFRVLDAGTWTEPHGDHSHHYTSAPRLTDVLHPAEEPGHVVAHDGHTALFDDGTGEVVVLDSDRVAAGADGARRLTTPSPHHGVAVALGDGTLVVSEGDEDERTGIRVLDAAGAEVASSVGCPGVHGEAVAADDAVVIGCEDGALVYAGGQVREVQSPDAYGRIGNQAGSGSSAVVLGDYKTDPDAELERPERVSVIDTASGDLQLVDLGASYSFRSLGRGPDGQGLVLGTDGALHVIDMEAGEVTDSFPVVGEWTEPLEWQEARPTLFVRGGTAYVTDPGAKALYAVDVATGEVTAETELPEATNELTGVETASA